MILGFALLFAIIAQATVDSSQAPNGAHFANGDSEPQCKIDTTTATVTCSATAIEGVGHTDATVVLAVTNTISGVCQNPGSKSMVVEPFSKSTTVPTPPTHLTPTKNGRLDVPTESATGTTNKKFLATFTCPNPNWKAKVTSNELSFKYTLTFDGFQNPFITITGSAPITG